MKDKYIYSGRESEVKSASGVSGVLIKLFGGSFAFRVYEDNGEFIDYEIIHDDLPITIDTDALASFYSSGDNRTLDHSPNVFGLVKVEN